MDIGFSQAGFEIRVMVEWGKAECDTLRLNWIKPEGYRKPKVIERAEPLYEGDDWSNLTHHDWYQERDPVILERDITTLPTSEILEAAGLQVGEADMVTGGFPCQGFSTARGKRYIDDPRNKLYKECVRVVREALPRMFLFENVPGLASMDGGKVIRQICDDLAASGYNVRWDILNAADYGVPQNRKRVFFIGECLDVMAVDTAKPKRVPRLHLAAIQGQVQYPEWFIVRYPQRLPF